MVKRLVCLAIALSITITVFAGCGVGAKVDSKKEETKAPEATKAETKAEDKKPVTLKFWFPGESSVNDEYFVNAGKEFESKNLNIKIEVTKLPTANTDIDVKLNAAVMSNDYPDVFSSYLMFLGTRGQRGEFADLKPYIEKWEDKGDIVESALDMGMVKGKYLGVGFYPAPELLVYRKDYFKEARLDAEKPPKTWDELKDYAYKLVKKDADGKVTRAGFDVPAAFADVHFRPFMRQAGSMVIDEQNEKPAFNDKASAEAFTFLTSLKDQSIPYDYGKKDDFPFMKGNAAMSMLLVPQIKKLISADPAMKDNLGFAPVLKKEKQVDFSGYRLFVMGEGSKNKDQAWEFIKFLMSKEQVLKRAKDLSIPAVRKSLEKEYIALNPALNAAISEYVKFGKGAELVPWSSVAMKHLRTAYEETYTGKKNAEQALKDAEAALNKDIEQQFKSK